MTTTTTPTLDEVAHAPHPLSDGDPCLPPPIPLAGRHAATATLVLAASGARIALTEMERARGCGEWSEATSSRLACAHALADRAKEILAEILHDSLTRGSSAL